MPSASDMGIMMATPGNNGKHAQYGVDLTEQVTLQTRSNAEQAEQSHGRVENDHVRLDGRLHDKRGAEREYERNDIRRNAQA